MRIDRTRRRMRAKSVHLLMVSADERYGDHRGHVARVRPAVAGAVLDIGVAGMEGDLRPVVEFEGDVAREYDAVVDGGRGVHAWLVGLEILGHTGKLPFELRQGGHDVEIRRRARP